MTIFPKSEVTRNSSFRAETFIFTIRVSRIVSDENKSQFN